ncbi:MAG: protein-glutamate O-methyltransferase [Hydrogenophilaceae bacterium]|nr:protein-glutamate O-methyltransferase [Hydrogenophilaceae bacterium]
MSAALRPRRGEVSIVEGEFLFTEEDFKRIASFLKEASGIHLQEAKATLVYSRLAKRLRKVGMRTFHEYLSFIATPSGAEERDAMLAALTTNVTRFFREPHHFDHLRDSVLARLAASVRGGARLRLWSSACSTGQEPYSMALTLLSAIPEATRLDVRILATDIDPVVVDTARAGVYSEEAVSAIPAALRDKWMSRERESGRTIWRAGAEMRSLIAFNTLNLIGEWPMRGKFDAIFCRNVVIYFEEHTQARIWTRFRSFLHPHGRLYIGHSERVDVPGYVSDGLTVYRLEGAP